MMYLMAPASFQRLMVYSAEKKRNGFVQLKNIIVFFCGAGAWLGRVPATVPPDKGTLSGAYGLLAACFCPLRCGGSENRVHKDIIMR